MKFRLDIGRPVPKFNFHRFFRDVGALNEALEQASTTQPTADESTDVNATAEVQSTTSTPAQSAPGSDVTTTFSTTTPSQTPSQSNETIIEIKPSQRMSHKIAKCMAKLQCREEKIAAFLQKNEITTKKFEKKFSKSKRRLERRFARQQHKIERQYKKSLRQQDREMDEKISKFHRYHDELRRDCMMKKAYGGRCGRRHGHHPRDHSEVSERPKFFNYPPRHPVWAKKQCLGMLERVKSTIEHVNAKSSPTTSTTSTPPATVVDEGQVKLNQLVTLLEDYMVTYLDPLVDSQVTPLDVPSTTSTTVESPIDAQPQQGAESIIGIDVNHHHHPFAPHHHHPFAPHHHHPFAPHHHAPHHHHHHHGHPFGRHHHHARGLFKGIGDMLFSLASGSTSSSTSPSDDSDDLSFSSFSSSSSSSPSSSDVDMIDEFPHHHRHRGHGHHFGRRHHHHHDHHHPRRHHREEDQPSEVLHPGFRHHFRRECAARHHLAQQSSQQDVPQAQQAQQQVPQTPSQDVPAEEPKEGQNDAIDAALSFFPRFGYGRNHHHHGHGFNRHHPGRRHHHHYHQEQQIQQQQPHQQQAQQQPQQAENETVPVQVQMCQPAGVDSPFFCGRGRRRLAIYRDLSFNPYKDTSDVPSTEIEKKQGEEVAVTPTVATTPVLTTTTTVQEPVDDIFAPVEEEAVASQTIVEAIPCTISISPIVAEEPVAVEEPTPVVVVAVVEEPAPVAPIIVEEITTTESTPASTVDFDTLFIQCDDLYKKRQAIIKRCKEVEEKVNQSASTESSTSSPSLLLRLLKQSLERIDREIDNTHKQLQIMIDSNDDGLELALGL